MLTQSTSTGIQFEVQVPLDSLSLNSSNEGGQTYTQVNLPGAAATAEVGEPQLPLMSQLLAVPFGVEIELKIQPGKSRVVEIENPVLPVATQKVEWLLPAINESFLDEPQVKLFYEPNQDIYTADLSYPGKLGEIVNDGVIRQQRVVSVALYPVQYNPSRSELTLYENISVSLSFKGGVQTAKSSFEQESTAYEELFRQKLLNYSTSHAWRLPVSQQELPETNQTLLSGLNTLPWTPPDPAWRIKVREEGVHRITYADLSEAGLDVDNIIPRTFRMFYKGQEIAVKVEGEEDKSFDVADNILFLAEPLENKYSLDNVYWLTYGSVDGSRMQPRSSEVPTNPAETHFIDRKNFESNNSYVTYPSGDDDFERFLWVDFYAYGGNPGIWEYSLPLNQPVNDPEADCILDLDLLGFSILPQGHHAEIFVNDLLLGELIWQGRTWSHLSTTFSSEHLLPVNTLKITLPNDQGALLDWIYVDRFSLRCPLGFRVQNNTLDFSFDLDGSNRFDLEGFNTNSLYLFDTSDPGNPQFLTDFQVQADEAEYTLSFQEAAGVTGEHSYLAVGTQAMKQVHAIEQDTPTTLEDPLNGADYLIITHEDFLAPAQTLADYRQSQGLRAVVVNVQDIYDQFGYGIVGKDPIHAFLSYVYQNWAAPAPSYVVLMGDGHYNPKGYNPAEYGAWRESFIPPYLAYADPALGETAADNRYVAFDGEGDLLPDMMLGRMAVMTDDQASAFVNKIMAYEQNPSTIDWQTPVLAVADNSDYGGNFPSISQFLISSSLPEEYQPQRVYLGVTHANIDDAKAAVIDAINSGKFLVNYIGHGATYQWADELGLLAVKYVDELTNLNKYPIISAMTCKEGYYINPHAAGSDYESLAEVITRAENKGAVASWSPTGNSVATGHDIINRELFVAIFSDLVPRVGQATQQSLLDLWASGTYLDLIDTYLLFGDPATILEGPPKNIYLPLILR